MINFLRHTWFSVVVCCMPLAMIPCHGYAQTPAPSDSTEFHFWYSTFDARSMALANATMADPLSSSGLYSNPGLLPFNSNQPGMVFHSAYNSQRNIFTENLTAPILNRNNKKLLLGATLLHNGPDRVLPTNNRQLLFTQFNVDIAYGQMLAPSISMGFKLNIDYGRTETANSITSNASLGFIYSPSPMISYGLVYKGTGYQNEWLGSGLSYYRTGQEATQITTIELPQRLEMGATLRFPSLTEHPDFVLSFSNEKLFGEPGLIYRGGIEIYVLDELSLLGGYFHSSMVKGGRVGLGVLFESMKINYAYTHNNLDLSGKSHLLSISINI